MSGREAGTAAIRLDTTHYDVIVLGTGLPEAIVAASLADSGHAVLHIDEHAYYGGQFASFSMPEFVAFIAGSTTASTQTPAASESQFWNASLLESRTAAPTPTAGAAMPSTAKLPLPLEKDACEFVAWKCLKSCPYRSAVMFAAPPSGNAEKATDEKGADENVGHGQVCDVTEDLEELLARKFAYSVCLAPMLLFSKGALVSLLVRSKVGQYLEFDPVDDMYIENGNGVHPVPFDRKSVFNSSELSLREKRELMKLMNAVLGTARSETVKQSDAELLEQFMDRPFGEYLCAHRLQPKLAAFVMYSIALVDHRQPAGDCNEQSAHATSESSRITTSQARARMDIFMQSIGRYSQGAFLYPRYGVGELPQGYCRMCAVKSGTYILRFPPQCLVLEKLSESDDRSVRVRGIISGSGQLLTADHIVCSPSYAAPYLLPNSVDLSPAMDAPLHCLSRCVVVADGPICAHDGQPLPRKGLFTFVPRTTGIVNAHPIRVLQLDSSLLVCPNGKYLVSFVTPSCGDSAQQELQGAVETLFDCRKLRRVSFTRCAEPTANAGALGFYGFDYRIDTGFSHSCRDSREDNANDGTARTPKPNASMISYWSQDVRKVDASRCPDGLVIMPDPQTMVDFGEMIEQTTLLLRHMYPDAAFFPEPPKPNKKSTYFEEDPGGLASLSDDDDDNGKDDDDDNNNNNNSNNNNDEDDGSKK